MNWIPERKMSDSDAGLVGDGDDDDNALCFDTMDTI